MDNQQRQAARALFIIVTTLEPRLRPLSGWFDETVRTIDLWSQSERNQGIKRAKAILLFGWRKLLGENPTYEDSFGSKEKKMFVSMEGDVPRLVSGLLKRVSKLKKDRRLMSGILSLIRVTDLWEGTPDKDTIVSAISTIVDSRLPQTAPRVIKEFGIFLDSLLCGAYDGYRFVRKMKADLHPGGKPNMHSHGPNGILSESAHLDVVTLRHSQTDQGSSSLLEGINRLRSNLNCWSSSALFDEERIGLGSFSDAELLSGEQYSSSPGRIGIVLEKSGKVRLVAAPDYYTQETLRPLGNWLFDILRAMEPDCTFDQRAAIPKICAWQVAGKTVYSFDQSSCTDLFPVEMQLEVLAKAFDRSLAESVRTVMTDRDWEITIPKSRVKKNLKWSVGQPMGIYASWPLMAVTHHLLVQFASWRATSDKSRWKPFEDYVVCGDDVVIAGVRVSTSYLKVVRALGMKVNISKSHISGGRTGVEPVSEFAKVTIWRGRPLHELKPRLVARAIRDWRLAVPLLWELRDPTGWRAHKYLLKSFILVYWSRQSRYLDFLLTVPHVFGGMGYRTGQSWREFVNSRTSVSLATEIHPLLYYLCRRIQSRLTQKRDEGTAPKGFTEFAWSGLAGDGLWSPQLSHHPGYQQLWESVWHRLENTPASVPTIEELFNQIMEFGWDKWIDLLSGEVKPEPVPSWVLANREQGQLKTNTWARILSAPKVLTDEAEFKIHTLSWQLVAPNLELTGDITIDRMMLHDSVTELQTTRIKEVLDRLETEGFPLEGCHK